MALPTTEDIKLYLRDEHAEDDVLLEQMRLRAIADIEGLIGYALVAVSRTHVDYAECDNYGVQPRITMPGPFKTSGPAPIVTDREGTTIAASQYYLDGRGMRILAKAGYSFPTRPYTVVADVGLSAHPDYPTSLEAVASTAIIEIVAHRYLNRNPATAQESNEGGGSKYLGVEAPHIPARIVQNLLLLPLPRGMGLA